MKSILRSTWGKADQIYGPISASSFAVSVNLLMIGAFAPSQMLASIFIIIKDFTHSTVEDVKCSRAKHPDLAVGRWYNKHMGDKWSLLRFKLVESGTHADNHIDFFDIVHWNLTFHVIN